MSTWAVSLSEPADEVILPVSFAGAADTGTTTGGGEAVPVSGGTTTTGSALPRTGSDTSTLALGGIAALITGGVLVLGSRRRRIVA